MLEADEEQVDERGAANDIGVLELLDESEPVFQRAFGRVPGLIHKAEGQPVPVTHHQPLS